MIRRIDIDGFNDLLWAIFGVVMCICGSLVMILGAVWIIVQIMGDL